MCETTAKANLIAAAMGNSGAKITNKTLLIKTLSRYGGEQSVQGSVANALTAMTSNYNAGRCPPHLTKLFNQDNLSSSIKETMAWVKEAMGVDEIYPNNPNLTTSADDTTLLLLKVWQMEVESGSGNW